MTPLQVARTLLANMPDEVFNIYIAPLIGSEGDWPFESLDQPSSPDVRRWERMFDNHTLETISQLKWKRFNVPFSLAAFHPSSQERITGIYDTHIRGMYTPFADIENARERFFNARNYLAATGRMPVPVILMYDPLGLRILDGNHRLAAMASFSNANAAMVDCWVGALQGFRPNG